MTVMMNFLPTWGNICYIYVRQPGATRQGQGAKFQGCRNLHPSPEDHNLVGGGNEDDEEGEESEVDKKGEDGEVDKKGEEDDEGGHLWFDISQWQSISGKEAGAVTFTLLFSSQITAHKIFSIFFR